MIADNEKNALLAFDPNALDDVQACREKVIDCIMQVLDIDQTTIAEQAYFCLHSGKELLEKVQAAMAKNGVHVDFDSESEGDLVGQEYLKVESPAEMLLGMYLLEHFDGEQEYEHDEHGS